MANAVITPATRFVAAQEVIAPIGPPPIWITTYAASGMRIARPIFSIQTCTAIVSKPRLPITSTEYAAEIGRNGAVIRSISAISLVSSPPLKSRASGSAVTQRMAANAMPSTSTGTTEATSVGPMRSVRPSARSRLIMRTRPVLPPSSANRLMIVKTAMATMTGPEAFAPSSRVRTASRTKLAAP